MRRFGHAVSLALTLALAVPSAAQAQGRVLGLWAAALAGGGTGRGETGRDFYEWAGGGAVGFEAGLRVLFLSAYLEYLRYFGGAVGANLWSVNLGGDHELRFGEHWGLVLRLAGSYYFGSLDDGQRLIDGRLFDSDWVDTRGVGFRAGLGPRYHFAKVFSTGILPQVGYHYFFHGSDVEPPLGRQSDSDGWDLQVLAYLRIAFGI